MNQASEESWADGRSRCRGGQSGGRSRIRWAGMLLILILPSLSGSQAHAQGKGLGVEFSEWGFDDRAVPRKFNLLTLEMQNSSPAPFDGTISLTRLLNGSASGAPLLQRVYIAPYQRRVVQFTPYVFDFSDEWEVRWGRSLDESETIEAPRLGAGSRVIFNDPGLTSGLASGLRGFRDDRFPTNVIGTDTLLCVVLDHAPRWESARRDVFRDWLYRGGVLHVLLNAEGKVPRLPVEELNSGEKPTRFGTGRIYWHDFQRGRLHDNRTFVYSQIYATAGVPVPVTDLLTREDTSDEDPTSMKFTTQLSTKTFLQTYAEWDSDLAIPFSLRDLVQAQTEHNWPLIYLLAVAYLLVIFPGGPWLAKKLDYRLNLLALTVVVASWCVFYSIVGARGYGERSTTQSLAIARPLPDGRWDVEQWSGVFVTSGDRFPITHQGEARHYSALVKDGERVDGFIEGGRSGRFVVDVPPFTSRTLAHRAVVPMDGPRVEVSKADWTSDGLLRNLSLELKSPFPTQIHKAVLIEGGRIHRVDEQSLKGLRTTLLLTQSRPGSETLDLDQTRHLNRQFRFRRQESEEQAFARLFSTMLARDIGIRLLSDRDTFQFPRDIARLCVYAELPEELSCRDGRHPEETLGFQNGRVLFSIDLPLSPPDTADTTPDAEGPTRPETN